MGLNLFSLNFNVLVSNQINFCSFRGCCFIPILLLVFSSLFLAKFFLVLFVIQSHFSFSNITVPKPFYLQHFCSLSQFYVFLFLGDHCAFLKCASGGNNLHFPKGQTHNQKGKRGLRNATLNRSSLCKKVSTLRCRKIGMCGLFKINELIINSGAGKINEMSNKIQGQILA